MWRLSILRLQWLSLHYVYMLLQLADYTVVCLTALVVVLNETIMREMFLEAKR